MTRTLNDKTRRTLQYAVGLMLATNARNDDWDDLDDRFRFESAEFEAKWKYVYAWQDIDLWMDRKEFLECKSTMMLAREGKLPLELEYWLDENPCEFGWCAYGIGFNDPDIAFYFKLRWL